VVSAFARNYRFVGFQNNVAGLSRRCQRGCHVSPCDAPSDIVGDQASGCSRPAAKACSSPVDEAPGGGGADLAFRFRVPCYRRPDRGAAVIRCRLWPVSVGPLSVAIADICRAQPNLGRAADRVDVQNAPRVGSSTHFRRRRIRRLQLFADGGYGLSETATRLKVSHDVSALRIQKSMLSPHQALNRTTAGSRQQQSRGAVGGRYCICGESGIRSCDRRRRWRNHAVSHSGMQGGPTRWPPATPTQTWARVSRS
jgi:hypothetical protein